MEKHPFGFKSLRDITVNDAGSYGSKACVLGELIGHGLPVPEGFAIPANALSGYLEHNRIRLKEKDLPLLNGKAAEAILKGSLPNPWIPSLEEAFDVLVRQAPGRELAVRSSALCEDGEDRSMAGLFSSVTCVGTFDEMASAIKTCWASLYSDRAIAYMLERDSSLSRLGMGVIIQVFVRGDLSGVVFTADTVAMNPDRLLVNVSEGSGADFNESRNPSALYACAKPDGRVLSREPKERGPILDEAALRPLVDAALRIEKLRGAHQDIEWTSAGGKVSIVQARPITTYRDPAFPFSWSRPEDSTRRWSLSYDFPLKPLIRDIDLRVREGENQGALEAGNWGFYQEIRFIHGYRYHTLKPMPDFESRNKAFLDRVAKLFDDHQNIFQDTILPGIRERQKRLRGQLRKADRPAAVARLLEDALEYACFSWSRHWLAIAGRLYIDRWSPDFRDTFKEWLEKRIGSVAFDDYFDLIYGESRLASSRRILAGMAAFVRADGRLSALFKACPYDILLYPRLKRFRDGRRLLGKVRRYVARMGLVNCDVDKTFTIPPLLLEQPSAILGGLPLWGGIRFFLEHTPESVGPSLNSTRRNKRRLIRTMRSKMPARDRKEFRTRLVLAEKSFLVSDDHAYWIDSQAYSFLRLAVKKAGTDLKVKGAIDGWEDIFFLGWDEAIAMLDGEATDAKRLVAERKSEHRHSEKIKAPASIGTQPELPRESVKKASETSVSTLKGFSGLAKKARGKIRIHGDPDFSVTEPCILVMRDGHSCDILPFAKNLLGLVYDGGSPFDHPGILARELGIPALYYTGSATTSLRDGETVELDGVLGEVRRRGEGKEAPSTSTDN